MRGFLSSRAGGALKVLQIFPVAFLVMGIIIALTDETNSAWLTIPLALGVELELVLVTFVMYHFYEKRGRI